MLRPVFSNIKFLESSDLPAIRTVRELPPYANKVKARKYIEEKSKCSPTMHTYVCTIAFLDWGLERNFILDLTNHKAHIIGTDDELFSAFTLPSIGEAVAAVLQKPEETKNRTVRVQDIKISLNKLLALAKKATSGTQRDVSYDNLDDLIAKADELLAKGLFDMKNFGQYLMKGTYGPGISGAHESTDNERLSLKEKTEDDVFKLIQTLLRF
ncbi:hypothetical protein E8E12_001044 [Didymella heteroderae]|uniref:Uncharacterized protein n=1 Tax=Didymella heteroderae TaxID=1769908 RepID=A0A9P4WRS6_9PLEO|nr:hypothetical protein E8E12_001044 [Didymella heteroderae]